MRTLSFILLVSFSIFHSVFAFEDLGKLEIAKKKYPHIFVSGSVNIITINQEPCYVFAGKTEQCFSGDMAESPSELYEEALLEAKVNFYEYFDKKQKSTVVKMSGCSVLYQYNTGKIYTVVLFVPQKNVQVQKKVQKTFTAPPKAAPVPPKAAPVPPKAAPVPSKAAPVPPKAAPVPQKAEPDAQKNFSSREKRLLAKINADPDNVYGYLSLYRLYIRNGLFLKAEKILSASMVPICKDRFFDKTEKCRLIVQLAELCESNGNVSEALKYWNLLLKSDPPLELRERAAAAINRLRFKQI